MNKTSYHNLTKQAKEQNTTVSELITAALEQFDTLEKAADSLGIRHPTLLYHMKENGITRGRRVVITKNAS